MANELRVRQLAIGGLVEDAPLTSGATTLTSAGLASVAAGIGSTQHLAIVLDPDGVDGAPEIIYVTALTALAGSGTVARGQEGTTARQHVAGTAWVHSQTLRDIVYSASAKRTAGDLTLNATNWTNVQTGLDLVLPAYAGDVIEYGVNFGAGSGAVTIDFDVATIVSASPVNSFAEDGAVQTAPGAVIVAWRGQNGVATGITGSTVYTLVAGDIASSTVTLRLRYATGTATNKVCSASTTSPMRVWAKNLGPKPG